MFSDVIQGFFLNVIPNFWVQCDHMYVSYIPFEVPCESKTQSARNKGQAQNWDAPWDKGKSLVTALEDKDNPNFLHILLTSVIIYNCDIGVITKLHMWSWFTIIPFHLWEGTIRQISKLYRILIPSNGCNSDCL